MLNHFVFKVDATPNVPSVLDIFGNLNVVSHLLNIIPDKSLCLRLTDANIKQLAWKHAAFIGPVFRAEEAMFWKQIERGTYDVDVQWFALYLAVLSVSLLVMNIMLSSHLDFYIVVRREFRLFGRRLLAVS